MPNFTECGQNELGVATLNRKRRHAHDPGIIFTKHIDQIVTFLSQSF
jgi:hypothetical protein